MKQAAVSALISGSLLLLSGCAAGPRYARPATSVPQQWTVDQSHGTNSLEPAADWWTAFKDPTLEKLIGRGVEANLDLKLAAARVAEARAQHGVETSKLFPTINASFSATRNRNLIVAVPGASQPSAGIVPLEVNNFQSGFDTLWELDFSGRIRKGMEAANADTAAAAEARRNVLVTVLGDIGRSYTELRGFQLRLDIAANNIRIQQDTLDLTKSRAAAGLATDLDVSRAQAQLETTRSAVPTLQSGVEVSIHRLSVLLGQEPGALLEELLPGAPVPLIPPQVPLGTPSELLERRPDIRQAEAQLDAAAARVGEAKAEWFPRFVLSGTAGRQANQLHDISLGLGNFFTAGPSISVPVFTGGRIRSNIRVQDARRRQAVISYQSTVLRALEETENALVNYAQEQTRLQRLESAVSSNRDAVHLASELYKAGLTDFLSVLDAQRDLYSNEDLLAQSRTTETTNLIALYKALGGGWQVFP